MWYTRDRSKLCGSCGALIDTDDTILLSVGQCATCELSRQRSNASRNYVLPPETDAAPASRLAAHHTTNSAVEEAEWTVHGWLSHADILVMPLSKALAAANPPDVTPLAFIQTYLTEATLATCLHNAGLSGLTEVVWAAVQRLRRAAPTPAEELQSKFLQDGAAVLSYSGLSTFFGGLEGVVGAPNPKIMEEMVAEHTKRSDSHETFRTDNYGIETCSSTEWRFVAEPEEPPDGGWPSEAKLTANAGGPLGVGNQALVEAGAKPRRPLPLCELRVIITTMNVEILAMKEPELLLEEAFGARLYTGPLFPKYNAVLRGLDTMVAFLRNDMIKRCCSGDVAGKYSRSELSYEAIRALHLNTYTTTIHAINSSIVKLSKLTVATKVYRGVHKLVLPEQFWQPNEYGVKGGIEPAFMSTTTNRNVAMSYAVMSGDGVAFVFEIQQGMVDRGADISFLSQYPHEQEILFAPLTGLEVHATRVDGATMVVTVGLSVNLAALTIEQVIGKRKKMLEDMLPGQAASLREKLRAIDGYEGRSELLVKDMLVQCKEGALSRMDSWYNDDEQLQRALDEILSAARCYLPNVQIWDARSVRLVNGDPVHESTSVQLVNGVAIMPRQVTIEVPSGFFAGCKLLRSISLPMGFERIGQQAFTSCSTLSEVKLPASLLSIGPLAFANCTALCNIELPEGLVNIEGSAFARCTALEAVMVPDTVKTIERFAFLDCSALLSISIHSSTCIDVHRHPNGGPSIPEHVVIIKR